MFSSGRMGQRAARSAMGLLFAAVCGLAASPAPAQSPRIERSPGSRRFAAARPFAQQSVLADGTVQLSLAPGAYDDLKTGSARRRVHLAQLAEGALELNLERFSVTRPDSRFVVDFGGGSASMPMPDVLLFRGEVAGEPGSHAFLSLSATGATNGYFTQLDGRRFTLTRSSAQTAAGPSVVLAEDRQGTGFPEASQACGVDHRHDARVARPSGGVARGGNAGLSPRVLFVAIDADEEFYQIFNDLSAAQAYIVQVIGAVSDIYIRDFDVKLVLAFSRVWAAGGEPFGAHDLEGFRNYWFVNEDPSPYHLVHLMSGRRDMSYAGIAYVAGSCSGSAYGISGYMLGSFPSPVEAPHLANWDVIVVAHEMGHNMGTFHTHDGYDPPIDQCGSKGIWQLSEIMSYCHTTPGGALNIEMRFSRRIQEVVRADLEFNDCQFYDCNGNNVGDFEDISAATSADGNFNQIPDECEDCNGNSILDPTEINQGAPDVNGDGVPDACQADCNGNFVPDIFETQNQHVADLNDNFVPDSCEPDCNASGGADFEEIRTGAVLDLDRNRVPDVCQDCNANETPDWIDLLRPENIYLADLSDYVREYHADSGVNVAVHGAGGVFDPYDVVFGPDRLLYVASHGDDRIVRIDPDAGTASTFVIAGSGGLDGPSGLAFGPNGNLFVSSLLTHSVLEFDGATGAFVRVFAAPGSGGLASPYGLTFGPSGNLFVAGGNRVNEYDGSSGAFVANFVAPGAGGLSDPRGMTFLPDGRLLVVNRATARVLAYDAGGAPLGQFNDLFTIGQPWGIAVMPSGNVLVTRSTGGVRIVEYDAASGRYLRSFIRADAGLLQPTGLAIRPDSPLDCNFNGVLDECDIAGGLEADENGNNIPDVCDAACNVAQPLSPAPDGINKNRYLSVDTASASLEMRAIQVTLADLPPPFESFEGQTRWVGPPQDRPDTLATTFKAGQLQCDPYYSNWAGVGVLSVFGDAVVPGGTYELRVIGAACDPQEQGSYSPPLEVATVPAWCDVIEPFNPPDPTEQPDFTDISALIDKFKNLPGALPMPRADVYPGVPDQDLNFSDISMAVDAFRGADYPFAGPTTCP